MLLSLLLEADRARDIIHRIALASGAKEIDGEISLARRCEQSFLKKRFPAHRLRHAHSEIAGEESMLRERRNGGWPFTKQSLNSVTQGPLWLPPRRSAAGIGRPFAPLGPMEAVAREAARRGKWLPSRPRKMAADGAGKRRGLGPGRVAGAASPSLPARRRRVNSMVIPAKLDGSDRRGPRRIVAVKSSDQGPHAH